MVGARIRTAPPAPLTLGEREICGAARLAGRFFIRASYPLLLRQPLASCGA